MARETKIGLLVGLAFIVLFGVILSERGSREAREPANTLTGGGELHEIIAEGERKGADPFSPQGDDELRMAEEGSVGVIGVADFREVPFKTTTPFGDDPAHGAVVAVQQGEEAPIAEPRLQTYAIKKGDTLTTIAREVYGPECGTLWRKIQEANADTIPDPRCLQIGQTIVIPALDVPNREPAREVVSVNSAELAEMLGLDSAGPAEVSAREEAPPATPRTYVVQPGDSFYRIARKLYGDESKAKLLIEKNKHLVSDPRRLQVGQEILLLETLPVETSSDKALASR